MEQSEANLEPVLPVSKLPNLLEKQPNMKNIYGLSNLNTPHLRFQILGDLDGFMEVITKEYSVQPDIKLMSQLIECIDNTLEAEEKLLKYLEKLKIKPDVDFFNQLMRKRVFRKDELNARELLDKINEYDLTPNIMTYGCVALSCKSIKDIFDLYHEMKAQNVSPNIQIMGTLIKLAALRSRPDAVLSLLKIMNFHQIKPDARLIGTLEKFVDRYRQYVIQLESGKNHNGKSVPIVVQKEFEKGLPNWKAFFQFYENWLKNTQVELPESQWKQYKTKRDKPNIFRN